MIKYIYELPPIDYWTGWNGIQSLQFRRNTEYPYTREIYLEDFKVWGSDDVMKFFNANEYDEAHSIQSAIALIKQHTCWEGDGHIFFTAQPNDRYTVALCFAIKQSNNGSTFICSDYPISNLSDYQVRVTTKVPVKKMQKLPSLRDLQKQIDDIYNSDKPF